MLRIYKVTGSSMLPVYQEGDYVLTSKIPAWARGVRPGDVIVFQHPLYGRLIKLVQQHDRQRDEITVRGLNDSSVDSRHFGPLPVRDVAGVVIAHFRKPG
jgi:nickel-type superoxide dismutase maturation protease